MKIKNYLLLTAAILTTVSSVEAGKFYAGAGAMYTQSYSTLRLSSHDNAAPNHVGSTTLSDSTSGISPRFFVGYEGYHHACVFSGEVVGSFSDMSKKTSLGTTIGIDSAGGTAQIAQEVFLKYKRNYTIGLRGKFGRDFSSDLSAFVGLGVISSQFKVTYGDNTPQQQSATKTVFGLEPAVGLSYKCSDKWRLGLEYIYQQYRSFNTKNLDSNAGFSAAAKSKFKFGSIFASVSYVI